MIYIIIAKERHGDGEFMKVGFSKTMGSVIRRLKSMKTGSPFELRLAYIFSGEMSLEKRIHVELYKYHVSGEWFRLEFHALLKVFRFLRSHGEIMLCEKYVETKMRSRPSYKGLNLTYELS